MIRRTAAIAGTEKNIPEFRKLLASEHSEQHQHRMHFDARAQQVRVQHVILENPVDHQKRDDPEQVRITARRCHDHDDHAANERTYCGNKFERRGRARQQQRIGTPAIERNVV